MATERLPPPTDAGFARWLATHAGEALLTLRDERGFAEPDQLRKRGDAGSHELITKLIARWRPGDAVLSEEGARDEGRLTADRVWIVDPLDGTREFGERGRDDWAVHVALWRRDSGHPAPLRPKKVKRPGSSGSLVAGAVALPARYQVLCTERPPLLPPTRGPEDRPLRLATSRTRPPAFLEPLGRVLGGIELVPMGSAGVKVCAVVSGAVDAYVHAGGQYEWDSAAPVAVATATGLHTSRIDGSALEYNLADPWLPDLVVCRRDLASRLLAALADVGALAR
jgi:3'(2'), 5'-bisphosphate nucleotidase